MPSLRSPLRSPIRSSVYSALAGKWPTGNPYSQFAYTMDFVANTYKGGFQTYGNNTNDGRFFRDSGVVNACFIPNAAGVLVPTTAAGMRRSTLGAIMYSNIGTSGLWNRDLTQTGSWTQNGITPLKNQPASDISGTANTASSLTATATNGTILQSVTAASANVILEVWIKRLVGTGTIFLTVDGGTTWNDVTSQVVSGSYTAIMITQAAVTNPQYGVMLGTSGDSVAVDLFSLHGQVGGQNIPSNHYAIQVGSAFGSIFHEVPWALNTDAGPLSGIVTGAYAFFWQGRGAVPNAGGLFVSDGVTNAQLAANNTVNFAASVNLGSATNSWVPGLNNRNKVAGWLDASGNMALCVNGQTPVHRTGGVLSPAATHFVLGSNGAGSLALNGIVEKFAITANLTFTDAQLVAMTT